MLLNETPHENFLRTPQLIIDQWFKRGVNCPTGVICDSLGVMRNQNRNFVLYYKRSLQNIVGNKT